ncbi:MAG: DUF937 domain-containing protein [Paracoccaceae bacterium]
MSLNALIRDAEGGRGIETVGREVGLAADEADRLTELLAPAIGKAVRKRAERGETERALTPMLGEDKAGFFDRPAEAASVAGQAQGQAFLEEILGSRDATRSLASAASERTGIDLGIVERFLPAIAAMLQGGLQKRMPDETLRGMMGGRAGGLLGGVMGMLGGLRRGGGGSDLGPLLALLDRDGDGSALDDVLEGLFRR